MTQRVRFVSTQDAFSIAQLILCSLSGTDRGNKYKIDKTVEAYDEVRSFTTVSQTRTLIDVPLTGLHSDRRPVDVSTAVYRPNRGDWNVPRWSSGKLVLLH